MDGTSITQVVEVQHNVIADMVREHAKRSMATLNGKDPVGSSSIAFDMVDDKVTAKVTYSNNGAGPRTKA